LKALGARHIAKAAHRSLDIPRRTNNTSPKNSIGMARMSQRIPLHSPP